LILNGDGKIEKAETQKKINELLGRNFLLFRNTCIFGQEDKKILTALNDKDKKILFENVLPELEVFKTGEENLKKEESDLKFKLQIAKANYEGLEVSLEKEEQEFKRFKNIIGKDYKKKLLEYNIKIKKIKSKIIPT